MDPPLPLYPGASMSWGNEAEIIPILGGNFGILGGKQKFLSI